MMLAYRKPELVEEAPQKKKKQKDREQSVKTNPSAKPKNKGVDQPSNSNNNAKKKSQFVNLYSKEGEATSVIKLPGRHPCECEARKHELINNCTQCGRIICSQEGSGPCLFCGDLVCTPEEMEILRKGSKKSEQLLKHLWGGKENLKQSYLRKLDSKSSAAAISHKNKLLDFDKSCEKRTRVIDDESDYFTVDSQWLSSKEREKLKTREEELRSKRHGSRLYKKFTFDFAGRRVYEEDSEEMYDADDPVVKQLTETELWNDPTSVVNSDISGPTPQYVTTSERPKSVAKWSKVTDSMNNLRIQDKESQEMCDHGLCLSMHQPWASLLVVGIKLHEGRGWYSPHRGRLWIASTAKPPSIEEIREVESFYKSRNKDVRFPKQYPVGCLLGCLDVVDIIPQEDYEKRFPEGESSSPYVFICENPQQLTVKFPIKGQHKIYKLDSKIFQAASKSLSIK